MGLADGWQRRFLFRSYLVLAASLLAVAALLDAGFSYLQSTLAPAQDRWLDATFRLIGTELESTPAGARDAAAAGIAGRIGIPVQVLAVDDVALAAPSSGETARLAEASGEISYLRRFPGGMAVRLGPLPPPRESLLLDLLPPLFYLSIFVVVGLWLRPILRDLERITRATQAFSADYREPTRTAGTVTQLTSLAQNLDDMSARLGSLVQSQKELTAALSHEMRTPLARIRFALAVMNEGSGERRREQLEAIGADLKEIDGLVASILEYARLDYPDQRMSCQLTPVEPWVRQTLENCRHPEPHVAISVAAACERAWMDPRLMGIALSNLVVNARRHARAAVKVSIAVENSRYRLDVEDDGEGVPGDQRELVFRAFSRLDESRNRDTGGFGLGLAIVARIAALHGGAASVDQAPELGGARFRIAWPEAAPLR